MTDTELRDTRPVPDGTSGTGGTGPAKPTSPSNRRRRTLALVVVASVTVSSAVAWFASGAIHSPAEVAARTAPPDASPILVPVEQRALATKVVTRGTGVYGSPNQLTITPSSFKQGPQVITSLPQPGTVIAEGDVAMRISGRPVFVLTGEAPSFRDLGPAMTGADVVALEQALQRLGFDPGAADGRYDSATGRAVAALYHARGFEPMTLSGGQLDALRPAEAEMVPGAQSEPGVHLPADEVVFVPAAPVRVQKRLADVGGRPEDAVLSVTDSVVAVEGALPVDKAGLVSAGADVLIDEPDLGIKAKGTITGVAKQPGTNGTDGFHVFFSVRVTDPPPALIGASVRLTVPIKTTGEKVLSVPVSAISLGADGSSRIQRSRGGTIEFVPVKPGLAADGFVAVTPTRGQLRRGDLVVVGFEEKGKRRA